MQKRLSHKKLSKKWIVYLLLSAFCAAKELLAWFTPWYADFYTRHIFPPVTRIFGGLTSIPEICVGEILICVGIIWLLVLALLTLQILLRLVFTYHRKNDLNYPKWRHAAGLFWKATAWIVLIIAIIMVNGCFIQYHCTPLEESLPGYGREYTLSDLTLLRDTVVQKVNQYAASLPRDADGNVLCGQYALQPARADADQHITVEYNSGVPISQYRLYAQEYMAQEAGEAVSLLSSEFPQLKGFQVTPKPMAFSGFISQQNMMGYYFPFSMEANYNEVMEDLNKPFTMCHEISHTHGYIYEDDANLLAFLACIKSSDQYFQYSGWLGILNYVNNDFYAAVSQEEYDSHTVISDQVWHDQQFLTEETWEIVEDRSSLETEKVKQAADTYVDTTLKANGVSAGKLSYSHVVALLLEYANGDMSVFE